MLAIKVENLSKQYRLGQIGTGTISHDLNRWWASLRGKEDPYSQIGAANDRTQKANSDYVWALKDINFEIEQGDAVGIIGRNGAGKSTLLKILSRTTLPTTGSVKMKGRIASLLEVGTGFHPEMTGRENIYQNGAILGMTRHEITRKFDEIVDFSGCEAYIDTPVKRYSSGMYVRLAFAVAAHLESEILIVDEVLAVGDAEFQKKCLGKMNDVAKGEGRTVLFVSHNMAAVRSLCNKGILMKDGTVYSHEDTLDAIESYKILSNFSRSNIEINAGVFNITRHRNKSYNSNYGIQVLKLFCNGVLSNTILSGSEFKFEFHIKCKEVAINPIVGFVINDSSGDPIIGINNKHIGKSFVNKDFMNGIFTCTIDKFPVYDNGNYSIDLYWGSSDDVYDIIEDACQFKVIPVNQYGTTQDLELRLNKYVIDKIDFKLENSNQL